MARSGIGRTRWLRSSRREKLASTTSTRLRRTTKKRIVISMPMATPSRNPRARMVTKITRMIA